MAFRKKTIQLFEIVENDARGDCLFHSLYQFFERNAIKNKPRTATGLRINVAKYITI